MKPTTFFDLPAELRNIIYAEVIDLTYDGVLTLHGSPDENDSHPHTKGKRKSVQDQTRSLLLASKQLYTETYPVFLAAHKVRVMDDAWPRIASMSQPHQSGIRHLIIDRISTKHLSTALENASQLPDLRTLDIRIPGFRFSRARPFLLNGFPGLQRLYISDLRVKTMAEHFAGEDQLPRLSCRVYSVEDFQTWRTCWGKLSRWRALDRELEKETRERMERMVVMRLC